MEYYSIKWIVLSCWISAAKVYVLGDCTTQAAGGRVWLDVGRPLTPGFAARLTAQFCLIQPVVVQLWEPEGNQWSLAWQLTWQPQDTLQQQTLELPESARVSITSNHRIGLAAVSPDTQISIRKKFDVDFKLRASNEDERCSVGDICAFDELLHPGTFAVAFCETACEPFIEDPVTPPNIDPVCQNVLWDCKGKAVLSTRPLPHRGLIKAVKTRFCDHNPVKLQIYSQNEAEDGLHVLVWEKIVSPILTSGDETTINLVPREYISIGDNFRLGVQTIGSNTNISIPHRFDPTNPHITSEMNDLIKCEDNAFGGLAYPYSFHVDLCYDSACLTEKSGPGAVSNMCDDTVYTESPSSSSRNVIGSSTTLSPYLPFVFFMCTAVQFTTSFQL